MGVCVGLAGEGVGGWYVCVSLCVGGGHVCVWGEGMFVCVVVCVWACVCVGLCVGGGHICVCGRVYVCVCVCVCVCVGLQVIQHVLENSSTMYFEFGHFQAWRHFVGVFSGMLRLFVVYSLTSVSL